MKTYLTNSVYIYLNFQICCDNGGRCTSSDRSSSASSSSSSQSSPPQYWNRVRKLRPAVSSNNLRRHNRSSRSCSWFCAVDECGECLQSQVKLAQHYTDRHSRAVTMDIVGEYFEKCHFILLDISLLSILHFLKTF